MMKSHLLILLPTFILSLNLVATAADKVEFNRDIRPILSSACYTCHGPDEAAREADLRLDQRAAAIRDLGGYAAIVPGDASASAVIERITSDDPDMRMPPAGKGRLLSPAEVDVLRRWIDQEAPYQTHWSYVAPQSPPLPAVQHADWVRNEIDAFVLHKMKAIGLQPTSEAERHVLARRVALTLTGLPPTREEVDAFLQDSNPDAYERYVDNQLKKPAFGERWARDWLDLARYADSAGYADDPERTIWAFRDYVIQSLNDNKPFDQFTIEQIAGDLLDSASEAQRIATAFHRNTMTNSEGGTNDEQFRNEAIVDRVNTTMAVWMGTTMACAQCHSHKYDPITQAEYFQFFDFFNQSADADRRDESPFLEVWSEAQLAKKKQLAEQELELQRLLDTQTTALDEALTVWLSEMKVEPKWTNAIPSSASNDQGPLMIDADGNISSTGDRPEQSTWTIHIPTTPGQSVAGLRLGIPKSQESNFVLNRVSATYNPDGTAAPRARFIRLSLPGEERILHLAEIEVVSSGANIALQAIATQSSTSYGGDAARINDGNTDGIYDKQSVTHTATEKDPWIELDLQSAQPVESVTVWNRTDSKPIEDRLKGFVIELLDPQRQVVWSATPDTIPAPSLALSPNGARSLNFHLALADYSQDNFPATSVLAPSGDNGATIDANRGWAIGGQTGTEHELSLFLSSPQTFDAGSLVLTLTQKSAFANHVLTGLNLAITEDPQATRWSQLPSDVRTLLVKDSTSDEEHQRLANYFRSITPLLAEPREQLAQTKKQLAELRPTTTVPIMQELPEEQHRVTKLQLRGNYLSTAEEVTAGVPTAFHPFPAGAPTNRLGLAQWIVDKNNPLTARVCVNRHWEQVFGTGIVETSEEFGSQGERPTHPELLDWLSVDLMNHGWDIKRLLKQMVMSASYRQSSLVTREALDVDPQNRWYARGPRFRISAEMVRDQALAVSGLLSNKILGPPVRPPQPQLGLSAAFGSATDWMTSEGEDRYRRAIYTTWRRSNPYPSMSTFDAPNREVCTLRRSRTNTPLQALVTLNDPVYVEASQALARTMLAESTLESQLQAGIQACLMRSGSEAEVKRLSDLFVELQQYYSQDLDAAKSLAELPLGPLPEKMDLPSAAAMTIVASTLLNLDETLMPL
jgi:hypothetical protein